MHIQPGNSLLLASLGLGREEVQEIQARKAAEVRRKLSSPHNTHESEDLFSPASGVERRSYNHEPPNRELSSHELLSDDDSFGKLFSAKA